jgi:hypothetical protein
MLHVQTATRWGAQAGFVQAVQRWTWCREALPTLMKALPRTDAISGPPVVDELALASAFWSWAATLDNHAHLEPLDPVDYAHYQVGMLLAQLLRRRPLRLPGADRNEEIRAVTAAALTVLAAWRQALGAPPIGDDLQLGPASRWSSYVENIAEDPTLAVAFLDLFTGREPVWRFPSLPTERPSLRRALEQRRTAD